MKKIQLSVLIFLLSGSLFAQLHIRGLVIDELTSTPVQQAYVLFQLSGIRCVTDSTGRFQAHVPEFETPQLQHAVYTYVQHHVETLADSTTGQRIIILTLYAISKNVLMDPVVIDGKRAGYYAPVTFSNISGYALNENNFGEDMPQLLEHETGITVTSDAGNGIGYTGIRIRGSDATRVNVSINGVPYNDAESQQTYWVDINDIAESADAVQIQRGVGTSQNGAANFGGAINITTNELDDNATAGMLVATGSYNLLKTTAFFGSGILNEHWLMEGRISRINADGYIDRSFSDLFSLALTSAYRSIDKTYTSIFNLFSGSEITYQSWGGVPKDSLLTNRTYNPYTYENQTDNYRQTHFQWHNILKKKRYETLQLTLNYTIGKGFYEQLEEDQYYTDYGLSNYILGSDTFYSSDMITQKWLDNDFYGAYLQYSKQYNALSLQSGAAYYHYGGTHFGKIIWAELAQPIGVQYEWYSNNAVKNDANIFLIVNYQIGRKAYLFTDMQLRNVTYSFLGLDVEAQPLQQEETSLFFNPKLGLSLEPKRNTLYYFSISKASKEPNRDDYIASSPLSRPTPETMYDIESGIKCEAEGIDMQANIYYMHYINQLVLTGKINDVGAYTRTNVPLSYRVGVELTGSKTFFSSFQWSANVALSKNKIQEYTEYIDNWDTGLQEAVTYTNTTIAFSPAVVAANNFEQTIRLPVKPYGNKPSSFVIGLKSKYVSSQYIDNTQNENRRLEAYFLNDLNLRFQKFSETFNELKLNFTVQNIFDIEYESNAWVYKYIYENTESEINGYFPQAGRTFIASLRVRF